MGCPGHTSGFKHFLTAVDGKVDVGVKHDDPQEGKGEPYLPLYVSFTRVGDPTLHFAGVTYCLTRTEWVSAVEPSQEDRDRLVTAARERVEADAARWFDDPWTGQEKVWV